MQFLFIDKILRCCFIVEYINHILLRDDIGNMVLTIYSTLCLVLDRIHGGRKLFLHQMLSGKIVICQVNSQNYRIRKIYFNNSFQYGYISLPHGCWT